MLLLTLRDTSFLPHGYCYLWNPGLLGLHLVSDSIITLSYYSIPLALVWFVRKRPDVPFNWMFGLFAVFIFGCGTTHLMEIWTLWHPSYWAAGVIKGLTAVASVGTAVALVPLLPRAVALPTPTQLERVNAELAAANRELESFAYSVSHDLRAPLRAVNGFAQALVEDHGPALAPEARAMLDTVQANSRRMGRLIDDLLAFSRLGRQALTASPVDMTALAREVADELTPADGAAQLRIEVAPLPPTQGDPALLRQVWLNLLGNAIKFSSGRPAPHVQVTGHQAEAETVYTVTDNGVGFDMRYADKLFGVFQRLHADREFQGTGVGLALVQRIVQRHGGRVWGEGRVDRGATFAFSLPTAPRSR